MNANIRRRALGVVTALLVFSVGAASAQGLWYKEVEKDGRVYVFNSSTRYEEWLKSGSMGSSISLSNHGPHGETVIAENETAIDLYNLKHDLPAYDRPAPKPAPPSNPTRLKIGANGELWFGGLLQGWYIADASVRTTGSQSDYLGNTAGYNTFRLRRAEMKMQGKFGHDWGFVVVIDPAKTLNTAIPAADGKILQDLAVQFFGLKGSEFAIGQLKIDVTEEGMRSSSELWFSERSQITRAISDIRQPGFFYKGDFADGLVTIWSALTNGQVANTLSDTNDTLLYTGRLDVKPMKGLIIGTSGGTGQTTGGTAHRNVMRWGAHVKYGGYGVPGSRLWLEAEYGQAQDEQVDGSKLKRWGMYASALYLFGDHLQVGFRYDVIRNNTALPRTYGYVYTTGIHWLQFGKNLNLKADWYYVNADGRTVNGVAHCCYNEYVLAAQAAF
jgi:hypothetical protein